MRFLLSLLLLASSLSQAELVVLVYHHVSDTTPASTSVSPDQFAEHLELIESLDMQVVDLIEHIEAMKQGRPVPERAIAITFDDAWQSIYDNAHPMLAARDWPYSIFVNTDPVDNQHSLNMSWNTIRALHKQGVQMLNHTSDHMHLVHEQFDNPDWLRESLASINRAQSRLEEELGATPKYLAFPYGEFNQALLEELATMGYTGFGQHSGAIGEQSNWLALPRFPAAGIYANPRTLRNKILSQPFDMAAPNYADKIVAEGDTLQIEMTMAEPVSFYKGYLQCFFNGETYQPDWQNNTATLSIPAGAQYGRHRINCTAPAGDGRFFWYSQPFLGHRDQSFPDY